MARLGEEGAASSEHPRGRYDDLKKGWYLVNGRMVLFRDGKSVKVMSVQKWNDLYGTKPTTTTTGSSSYGGGGGTSPTKAYMNYYTRILNIKPNMSLVNEAAKGNYTMQEFQLLVQRRDTDRFLKTWQGQQVADQYKTLWWRIFPGLGSQPGLRSLKMFLQQKPAKGVAGVTNPTSIRSMYAFLSKTKLFKKTYPEFEKTGFVDTLNFAGYREYKRQFSKIYGAYTGMSPAEGEMREFFRSNIDPQKFEQNIKTMTMGGEAYKYATGQAIDSAQRKTALYGNKGSERTLERIAAAYQSRENFQKAKVSGFALEREQDTRRIVQKSAY